MNLFFWKQKKYDEEMEKYVKESQLYPHLQAALLVIDDCISGVLHLEYRLKHEKTIGESLVSLWHITEKSIRLKVYEKKFHTCVLSIESAYFSKTHKTYDFVLTLPMANGEKEIIHIENTNIYKEIKKKMFYLHSPKRLKESKEKRSKRILKENSQKHRLQNLFK